MVNNVVDPPPGKGALVVGSVIVAVPPSVEAEAEAVVVAR
jgi:hypothetical protein